MFSQVSVIVFTQGEGWGLVGCLWSFVLSGGFVVSSTRSPLVRLRDWYVRGDCWVFPGVDMSEGSCLCWGVGTYQLPRHGTSDGVGNGMHPPPGHAGPGMQS